MKYRLLPTLCAALLISACGTACAATCALVDFGTAIGSAYNAAPNTNYQNIQMNNLQSLNNTGTSWNLTVTNFRAESNASTSLAANLWDGKTGLSDLAASLGIAQIDPACWRDSFFITNTNGAATVLSLSGLLANHVYEISFGVGRKGSSGQTNISIPTGTLEGGSWVQSNGLSGDTPASNVPGSLVDNQRLVTYQIRSNAAGELAVNFGNVGFQGINFMAIKETGAIPEPATLGLMLVGGYALLARRRKNA